MNKNVSRNIGVGVLVIVIIGGIVLFLSADRLDYEGSGLTEFSGRVVAVDSEQVMLDGPYMITVQVDSNSQEVVEVPSMGMPQCDAFDSINEVPSLIEGSRITVRGMRNNSGRVVPCDDLSHFVRIDSMPIAQVVPPVDATDTVRATLLSVVSERYTEAESIAIIELNETEWPDGCLGVPTEDEMCTTALVTGYRAVVQVDEEEIIFRMNEDASVVRLEM